MENPRRTALAERVGNNTVDVADSTSSELLLNIIRSLRTSSNDQREVERKRLEMGYEDSGRVIDKLLKEHHSDVSDCLNTFRKVSNGITTCRERIHNVKTALHTTKALLQCRRDDLKKLWVESAEQNYLSSILQQIHEIKHMDQTIAESVKKAKYKEAEDTLKRANILLNGPLYGIDGLNQLRTNLSEASQNLLEQIVQDLLQCLIIGPFEFQILNLMKGLSDSVLMENGVCSSLILKYSNNLGTSSSLITSTPDSATINPTIVLSQLDSSTNYRLLPSLTATEDSVDVDQPNNSLSAQCTQEWALAKCVETLEALKVFDEYDRAIDQIFMKMSSLCIKLVNMTIEVMQLHVRDGVTDQSHLAQLTQVMIQQLSNTASRFKMFCTELSRIRTGYSRLLAEQKFQRFWDQLQNVFESVLSDHLDIWRSSTTDKPQDSDGHGRKALFSFENTSFSSTANTSLLKKKQLKLICPSTPYNITAIFHILNRFTSKIEQDVPEPCKLKTFLHSFVMDTFIERIKTDMEQKAEQSLSGTDVWHALSTVPSHNVKILTSCVRIYELCEQINNFIKNMVSYTQRFASLWVLIIADYTRRAMEMYSKIIQTRSQQGENIVNQQKISAAWAVDEDISRLLKSLPNWLNEWSPMTSGNLGDQTPSIAMAGGMNLNESEQEIRLRTQRESDILISNLGTPKQIKQEDLITDMNHLRSLVCMHESLQWFVTNMRLIIVNLPPLAQEIIKCRIQMTTVNGQSVEQLLSTALNEQLTTLEDMSEKCLLMLHLEIRVHCFYHLLPLARPKSSNLPQDEQDHEIAEFGRDLEQYHQTLAKYIVPNKLKYLFDGLGHLCASIFIHSSQHMTKLTESDRKRICRNIFVVQKHLSKLSGRPETELNRAQTFFKLVQMDFDQNKIFAYIRETGESYSYMEYTYLFSLAVKSHPTLSSQPGALDAILKQLRQNSDQLNITS